MLKRLKISNSEYRLIQSDDVKEISLVKQLDIKLNKEIYMLDINFGEYGILAGSYTDMVKAEEVVSEVKEYLSNESEEEYILPTE